VQTIIEIFHASFVSSILFRGFEELKSIQQDSINFADHPKNSKCLTTEEDVFVNEFADCRINHQIPTDRPRESRLPYLRIYLQWRK
jgi:hypothetical protein